MMSFELIKKLLLIFFGLALLTGCADDNFDDLEDYIRSVKARPKGAIEPLPEIKVVEPFIFNPDGLRNPFMVEEQSVEEEEYEQAAGSAIRPDPTRRKEELEYYTLDSLRMVGTLRMKVSGLWALVRASDGTIHRVQAGHYMGKNHGKILRVLADKIELMEIVPDTKPGFWIEQQAALALAEQE